MLRTKLIILGIFLSVFANESNSQSYIRNININRLNVFDTTQTDWFFAAPFINSLHVLTKEYIIKDALVFDEDEEIDIQRIYETERNLRDLDLFYDVKIDIDSIDEENYDIFITTKDKWSTQPNVLFGSGGNSENYGVRLTEYNLAGTATVISLEALYRSESNIGWQGTIAIAQKRLFRTELCLEASLLGHENRTQQFISINKPFRTLDTKNSYGINLKNYFGSDFYYYNTDTFMLLPFHERIVQGWYSQAWRRSDRVFATLFLEYNDVHRADTNDIRAFDNSGKILIAFSSVSENYIKTNKLNHFLVEDLPIGGWGTAIIGKTFSIGSQGISTYYVGAQGEKSYLWGNLYVFGQITGSSAFINSNGVYTYEEFLGLAFYRFTNYFLLAARVRQQTVWNWYANRQLILDNDAGLRGYAANNLQGDNRLITNLEFRLFPDFSAWIFQVSLAAFYDGGSVWNQRVDLNNIRWHNSVGAGFRFHNTKSTSGNSIIRIDFAYNLDENKLGQIIFSSDQLFSVFKKHVFNLPYTFGNEFDIE